LPLAFNGAHRSAPETPPSSVIQIAVKDNRGPIFYFAETVPFELLFSADGYVERKNGDHHIITSTPAAHQHQRLTDSCVGIHCSNLEAPVFLQSWGELAATERSFTLPITSPVNLTQIQERLSHANIFTVARRALADRVRYVSCRPRGVRATHILSLSLSLSLSLAYQWNGGGGLWFVVVVVVQRRLLTHNLT